MIRYRSFLSGFCLAFAIGCAALADDSTVIGQSVDAFTKAFNNHDAKAVAALWTEKGRLVDETGRVFNGRSEIEQAYAEFFRANPNVKITVQPGTTRKLFDASLLEEGTAMIDPAPRDTSGTSNYTAVHVEQNGKWLMSNVREWSGTAPADSKLLQDLGWLVGTWTGEEHGATTTIECRWLPNNSYLERKFTVTAADGTTIGGIQLIGANPRTGQVVSWGFNYDGGHTIGAWFPRENGWGIEAAGVKPDGTSTHAINIITRIDDNGYSWQSVERKSGDQSLPNTDQIVLKRSEAKERK